MAVERVKVRKLNARNIRNGLKRLVCLGLMLLLAGSVPVHADDGETVVLQLKWLHQFQFAGYYAALEKGYYHDAGLNVIIHEAVPGQDPFREVLDGSAHFGVGNSDLLDYLAQPQKPVVLANIYQHSALAFIALQGKYPPSIHSIVNGPIMLEPGSSELEFYLQEEGISLQDVKTVDHSFNMQDLIDGRVTAMSAYVSKEPFELERRGIPYVVLSPQQAGIDLYGDNLFTSIAEVRQHPERVKAFRDASLKGWKYAMENPDEIIDLIHEKYAPHLDKEALKFEAARITELIQPDLVEIGYSNPERWRNIAGHYQKNGAVISPAALDDLLYIENLRFSPDQMLLMLFGILSSAAVIIIILSVNRQLRDTAKRARDAGLELRTIMENIDQAIARIDSQGRLTAYNNKYIEFSGYDADYLATKPFFSEMIDQWALKNHISDEIRAWNHQIVRDRISANLNLNHGGKIYEMQHRPMADGGYVRTYSDITALWNLNELLRKNEQKFRDLLMDLPSAITVTAEEDGRLLYMNRAAIEITGTDEKTALGADAGTFWEHPEERRLFVEQVRKDGFVTSFMTRLTRRGQPPFWVSISSRRTTFDGCNAFFSIFMDVDERKRSDEKLLETEKRFRELLAITPTAIVVARMSDDRIVFFNDHARKILAAGDEQKDLTISGFLVKPDSLKSLQQKIRQNHTVSNYEVELKTAEGGSLWVIASSVLGEFEGDSVIITAFTNISESKAAEAKLLVSQAQLETVNNELKRVNSELEQMASIDLLTRAWNRREFERVARIEMSRAQRYEQSLCLLLFDIDHFKDVNDHYGHLAGDVVLRELCDLVRANIRAMDSLTRWGGEEFVILAPGISHEAAMELGEKLRLLVAEHLFPEVGPITVSIGVAEYARGQTLDEWISCGDQAMYKAKALGRNRVCSQICLVAPS